MDTSHHPAPPRDPDPPSILRRLAQQGPNGPGVRGIGLTTTSRGEWALLVQVERGALTPLPEIERQAQGHPVVYVETRDLPVARPAYPARGE